MENGIPGRWTMTAHDDATVLVSPIGDGNLYLATYRNISERNRSMAGAYRAIVAAFPAPLPVRVIVGTQVSAEQLIALLREVGDPRHLDLSMCRLEGIDLRPQTLDTMAVEDGLRWGITGGIDLSGVNLQDARLKDAQLEGAELGHARLKGAWLEGANLQRAWFMYANLADAILWDADLRDAHLESADLRGAQLRDAKLGGADLGEADLREVDFGGVASLDRVRWHNARLEKMWLYKHQIEPVQDELEATSGSGRHWKPGTSYREAMETYLSLKTNFLTVGMYEGAAWAYVKEQQMRKANYFPTSPGKRWIVSVLRRAQEHSPPQEWWHCSPRALRYRLRSAYLHLRVFLGLVPPDTKKAMREELSRRRWARNWFYELLTGYGERPFSPLITGALIILAFALAFWLTGSVGDRDRPAWFNSFSPADIDWSGLIDGLVYSIATFATFNLGRVGLNPEGRGVEAASSLEALLGIGILALFVFTLGNRMRGS